MIRPAVIIVFRGGDTGSILLLLLSDATHLNFRSCVFFLSLRLDVFIVLCHLLLDVSDHCSFLPAVIEVLHSSGLFLNWLFVVRLLASLVSSVTHQLHVGLGCFCLVLLHGLLFLRPLRFSLSFPFKGLLLLLLDSVLLLSLSLGLLLLSLLSFGCISLSLGLGSGFFGVFLLTSIFTFFAFCFVET